MHELLTNLPSVRLMETRVGFLRAEVPSDQFAVALDELVNCRTLASTSSTFGLEEASALSSQGLSLCHLYGTDEREERGVFSIHAVLHDDTTRSWLLLSADIDPREAHYPSVTRFIMSAQWYERYIADMFGIQPVEHPDLRRLVHHEHMPLEIYPMRKDFALQTFPERDDIPHPLHQVAGEGVYEIGAGPVYNRVAESLHFRLNTAGERIMTLEIKPFYKHRGVEKILEGKSLTDALPFLERVAADATVSFALAFSQAAEDMSGTQVSTRAKCIRSLLNEVERVLMHVEDIANTAGIGAGYTAMKNGSAIKEEIMQLSDRLFGNRFFRGVIVPGGLSREITQAEVDEIKTVLVRSIDSMLVRLGSAMRSDGLRDRLELSGVLKKNAAMVYGAVGVVARASGVDRDVRRDQPYAAYDRFAPRVFTSSQGDVFARLKVRGDELQDSRRLIIDLSGHLGDGPYHVPCHPESGLGISAVESGRGELIAVIIIKNGVIERCTLRDPSFVNFPLLQEIIPTNVLSDFPLCARSLGLSVSAMDL